MLRDRRWMLAGALGVALVWWLCRGPAVPVMEARVDRGALSVRVTTNGKVEPVKDVEVRARLDGRILEIPEPGTTVEEGDVVLRIDGGPASAELAKARSQRLEALESLRAARTHLARVRERAAADQKLFEEGAITRERNAESQAALRDARAHVAFLEEEVPLRVAALDLRTQELSAQVEEAELGAPIAGTVYRTERRPGEMVRVGDPILRIADLGALRVRVNIDQVDLGRVKPDQRVSITSNAYPDRSWSGVVSEVIPHVKVKRSRAISEGLVRAAPPTNGLVPGMSVDIEIVVAEASDVIQIPAEAVFTEDALTFVYRIDGRRARRTPVTLGLTTVSRVQVLEGLEPDERVVLGPAPGLGDGDRVEIRSGNESEA